MSILFPNLSCWRFDDEMDVLVQYMREQQRERDVEEAEPAGESAGETTDEGEESTVAVRFISGGC